MAKIYECETCGQNFKKVYNLQRHQRTQHWRNERVIAVCDVCGKMFSRLDNMRQHRKLHDRLKTESPNKENEQDSIEMENENVPSPAAELCNKQTRKRQRSGDDPDARTSKKLGLISVGNEFPIDIADRLVNEPDLLKFYRTNWRMIRSSIKKGKILTKYNCYLPTLDNINLEKCAEEVFEKQTNAFKVNAAFGFILLNSETDERRFYYSSRNTRLFESPFLVKDRSTFQTFYDSLKELDPLEYARLQRPNSKWVVDAVTNVTFFVYRIRDHPIGACSDLPAYIMKNRAIVSLIIDNNTKKPYRDNLCLFRCIALHKEHHRNVLEGKTKALLKEFSNQTSKDFKGVTVSQLQEIEDLFKINITVFELVDLGEHSVDDDDTAKARDTVVARIVRRSLEKHSTTMYINLHKEHFSYISNLEKYTHSYSCRKCQKLWTTGRQLHRHEATCECKGTTDVFPRGVYVNSQSIFDELREEDINVPRESDYFPHWATYDFESYTQKTSMESGGDKLQWTNEHVPLSVSISSNVPGYEKPTCFVGEPKEIVGDMIHNLIEMSTRSYSILRESFQAVSDELEEKIQKLTGDDESKKQKKRFETLLSKLNSHLKQLPVFGFNSGNYDLNLIKKYLLPFLVENEPVKHLVKRNNNYMSIDTENLRFLDVTNFLAPGFSYDQFLRAYDCSQRKGIFPYEWIHPKKLDQTFLPSKEAFDSTLKGTSITDEDYTYCQDVWNREGMKTVRDYLVWYNNLDVEPFIEALGKMAKTYRDVGIDLFKDGISVPGLTLKYLFKISPSANFALFGKQDSDLYDNFRRNLVGGPSIVFARYHESGKTRIRGGKLCEKIQGYDANALYLWALKQQMPTGYPTRRKEETGFKKERKHFSITAQDWLDWEAYNRDVHIRHEGNNTEKRVGPRMLPVDGWCAETKQVFEMQGCYFHGHPCKSNPHHGEKEMRMKYAKTLEKREYLEKLGYEFIEMWECEFYHLKGVNRDLQQFLHDRKKPLDHKVNLSVAEIIQEIISGRLFGCIECDIHVPDQLKPYFSEMTPVFKNIDISRDDIGPFMKAYGEEHGIMNNPRKSLIGSMFGEKVLLATPLLKWYLEHGLQITRVYQVVEYTPISCFTEFADAVSDARRGGDIDPSKSIIADTMKLMGNSSYGKTITNKYKHRNSKIASSSKATQLVNDLLFRDLNPITDDCYEVEMAKAKIKHDLPIQIGFFVYQYAKLKMLQFYFDFLDVFLDRSDFEYVQMDTDSAYFAISGDSIDSLVKPELLQKFEQEKGNWFPRTDTDDHRLYDKRTPGLFKLEWEGDGIVALCSKTWYGFGPKNKFSCKGANKKNNVIDKEKYLRVLKGQVAESAINRGFRVKDNRVLTYQQERAAFTYFYPKRKVANDGISTTYLDI